MTAARKIFSDLHTTDNHVNFVQSIEEIVWKRYVIELTRQGERVSPISLKRAAEQVLAKCSIKGELIEAGNDELLVVLTNAVDAAKFARVAARAHYLRVRAQRSVISCLPARPAANWQLHLIINEVLLGSDYRLLGAADNRVLISLPESSALAAFVKLHERCYCHGVNGKRGIN